ncbi:MAG: DNA starvation/stationary phase protection protein [Gammaproteobacteria bacterium]|nr:DNA starvation/stationary phase protection protein [Gammaproteobacteria bacterium]
MSVKIGISDKNCSQIVKQLSVIMSDTYLLYVKTQNFHWNVTSPLFPSLHLMFESQYEELQGAVDVLAERIRALGHFSPGSFAQFTSFGNIKESTKVPSANDMLKQLLADHELLCREIRDAIPAIQKLGDEVSGDTLIERLTQHEKTAWMLRSSIS